MIKELKKKRDKFGAIISFVREEAELQEILSHNAVSAYVIAHRVGLSEDKGYGLNIVGHRTTPKFKNVVGHYLTQVRGGEPVVFLKAGSALLEDGSRFYNHLDSLRLDRAYAIYLGPEESPVSVIMSATLMEHLFHAIPDQLNMEGDWVGMIHGWLKKSLLGGRYIDGNQLVSLVSKEKVPVESYIIEPDPVMADAGSAVTAPVFEEPEAPVKRKPGRPKTKK